LGGSAAIMTETAGVPPADATAEKNAAEAVPANGTGAQHNENPEAMWN